MGMEPVDMSAVDRMGDETAAQSEQGAQNLGDALHSFGDATGGRTAAFTQGALAGRAVPASKGR